MNFSGRCTPMYGAIYGVQLLLLMISSFLSLLFKFKQTETSYIVHNGDAPVVPWRILPVGYSLV